jgi:hypothetical protein
MIEQIGTEIAQLASIGYSVIQRDLQHSLMQKAWLAIAV